MNFLAHLFLSKNNKNLIIGNFIADFIKGNNYKHLPLEIQNGIFLHRKIDSFTDAHPVVRQSKRRLHERYGHYNGVIIDVFYDHFLAKDWTNYSTIPLLQTEAHFIQVLKDNLSYLPEKVIQILPYLEEQKWLSNYSNFTGIEKSLIGINKRTQNKSQMHLAIEDLHQYYEEFNTDFTHFFKALMVYSDRQITLLNIKKVP